MVLMEAGWRCCAAASISDLGPRQAFVSREKGTYVRLYDAPAARSLESTSIARIGKQPQLARSFSQTRRLAARAAGGTGRHSEVVATEASPLVI